MLTEKRSFFLGMNGDDSPRLLDDKSSLNLMNCRMGVTKYGRNGRIENTPGTTQVSQTVYPPYGNSQTIGSAQDLEEQRLIFVNYNTFEDHGIYCYDPSANNGAGFIYAVLYDSQVIGGLGLSKNSLIHSCRVQNGCFYWVDGTNNEPRRININAGIEMNHNGTFPDVRRYDYPMTQSVIRWIRRQPGLLLNAAKAYDVNYDNNFIKNEAFQFSWRYIYRDYEISTLSGLSDLMNYNLATENYNYIALTAPLGEQIDQDVLQVDYVVKYLNGGKSFVTKSWNRNIASDLVEINAHNAGTTPLTFNFYNDFTGLILDDAYSVKPFDSLPIYAQTMEMAKFRAFMANYTIGYDTPTITSLTASAIVAQNTDTVYANWVAVTYNFGLNTHYFLDIRSMQTGNGYYDAAPQPPPFPGTIDFSLLTLVAVGPSNFANYLVANYANWTGGFPETGDTSIITSPPSPPAGLAGDVAFKSGASYQLSISFFDHAGRKTGVLTNESLKLSIDERAYTQINYTTAINWVLSNLNALGEIPDTAYYYTIGITKCLSTRYFLQSRARNITYVTKDADGAYVFNTSAYSATLNGIGIDITRLNSYAMGYNYSAGDLVKVYIGSAVTNLSVIAQEGNWIVCELKNIGGIGNTATPFLTSLFEIYTPYKSSLSEPFYETDIFPVTNPTEISREYSTLAGTINGDITLLTRNDGTADYLTENMSPNDKYYQIWNTNTGRPNFIDYIGQQVNTDKVAFSNTFISGTKVNGLSTFDALDTRDIQCGTITKLQVANKIGEDQGDIMLAICENETASLYLGEVQLVGQQGNAFVAQALGVIGTINVLKGSLGTTRAESVSEYLGLVFGIDLNKGIFWQYSNAGLEPISRYKMSRFFKNYCDAYLAANANNLDNINGFHHIRSYIDPFHKELLVTLPALIYENYAENLPSYQSVPYYASSIINRFDIWDSLGKTMSFQFEENKWGSNYEWLPEWSDYLQNQCYGFKNGNLYIFNSNTSAWNTVFEVQYPVRICCTGNLEPSLLKDLANVALESNAAPEFSVAMATYPNVQITDLVASDYDDQQGIFYASWFTDRLDPNSVGSFGDDKLYTGSQLTDFSLYFMFEFQQYTDLFFCNFVNVGYETSRGQLGVVNVINK